MCDVRISLSLDIRARLIGNWRFTLQVCKYSAKTKARITRLSSNEAALANVPFSRTTATISDAASSSRSRLAADCRNSERQLSLRAGPSSLVAQKRGLGFEDPGGSNQGTTKRPKKACVPVLGLYLGWERFH